jgi:hypothetical protein
MGENKMPDAGLNLSVASGRNSAAVFSRLHQSMLQKAFAGKWA